MLHNRYKLLAMLLAMLCLLPILSLAVTAAGGESSGEQALYVEKYVSVLYDNSGSMNRKDNADVPNACRSDYANYAFQMMASMMNGEDKLWVTPMNKSGSETATITDAIPFVFSSDRQKDISEFAAKYLAKDKPLFYINGAATPLTSISVATERLFKTDDIKDYAEKSDRKHWLVIMTDGAFTGDDRMNVDISETVAEISRLMEENPELNIIYCAMGSAVDLGTTELATRYAGRFFSKMSKNPDELSATMRDVMNLMSDRYTLNIDKEDFITMSADKKTATIKLSYVDFPLQSVSFAVQNFGGKLTKATYSGKTFTPENCIITPPGDLGMQSGTTGIIRDTGANPILFNTADSSGELVLYFDKPVEEANIALMAEPSLYIKAVFEYESDGKWIEANEVEVMKRVKAGEKIKIGYRVYNGATGKPYADLDKLPGKTVGTLWSNGALIDDKLTGMSDPVTLQVGSNPFKLGVSLMDGVYRLEKSVDIKIIGSTAGYDMKASYTAPTASEPYKSTSIFTPMKNNAAMTKDEVSEYLPSVTVKNMEGNVVTAASSVKLLDNGSFEVSLDLSSQPFGEYSLEFTLSHNFYPITISAQTLPQYYPAKIELSLQGEKEIEKTQNGFDRGQTRAFTFLLTADGKNFDFNNGLLTYELKFGNTVISPDQYTVLGNKLSFVPNKETVGALLGKDPASYAVTLTASSAAHSHLTASAEATLKITETRLEVFVEKNDQLPIDRFDIQDTPAEVYFSVLCDDDYLTLDELKVALGQAEKDDATATIGTLTIESAWCDSFLYPVNLTEPEVTTMTVDGKSRAVVRVAIEAGHVGFVREHFTSWLIPKGDKPITATYTNATKSASVETAFVLKTSEAWSYIWRLLVILLWIHLVLCVLMNSKVPRHRKGYFVCLNVGSTDSARPTVRHTRINMSFMKRAIPLRWFIPFHPILVQKRMGCQQISFDFKKAEANKNGKGYMPVDKTVDKAVFERAGLIFTQAQLEGDAAPLFKQYMRGCAAQSNPTNASLTPRALTNGNLRQIFAPIIEHEDINAAANYVPRNGVCRRFSESNVYAFYSERTSSNGKVTFERLQNVVFFVPKK